MAKKKEPVLKLITQYGKRGYTMNNIKQVLGAKSYDRFCNWIGGQTVMQYKGDIFVYENDLVRFALGGPAMITSSTRFPYSEKTRKLLKKLYPNSKYARY